ncbi:hypothetical protein [Pseudomonas sp. CGJS7]|uniref:hypothetical protein n=1 Tax=Pseudomonas sp. CGJS7 TaxID=3109348 RepID=UPI0030098B7C
MKFRPLALLVIVVSCALMSCKTIDPANSMLKDMQERATPEPYDSVSPAHEQRRAKAEMVRWVERYLKHEYRVVDRRFVLAAPGDTNFAWIGSKAHQFVTQTLGGTMKTDGWFDDDNYMMFLWEFGGGPPRYVAFAITNDFLPGTRERALIGYFELLPSTKR